VSIDAFKLSIDVRIPTNAAIPRAIMDADMIVLSRLDLMDLMPSRIFSFKFIVLNLSKIIIYLAVL
jgi:hypothetical protein